MKNNVIKILSVFIILVMMTFSQTLAKSTVSEIFSDAEKFVSGDTTGSSGSDIPIDEDKINSLSIVISNVLLSVGIVVAFISIGLMGIRFMVQSAEEKAKIKEALIPFCIGAIVTFGAFGIWKVAVNLFIQI